MASSGRHVTPGRSPSRSSARPGACARPDSEERTVTDQCTFLVALCPHSAALQTREKAAASRGKLSQQTCPALAPRNQRASLQPPPPSSRRASIESRPSYRGRPSGVFPAQYSRPLLFSDAPISQSSVTHTAPVPVFLFLSLLPPTVNPEP